MVPYIGVYLLAYGLFALCIIVPPTEFISAGLTLEHIFKLFIGQEHVHFIEYHLRRTALNLLAHSLLPLVFFLFLEYMEDSANFFFGYANLDVSWQCAVAVSFLLPLTASVLIFYWMANDWSNHPTVKTLKLYDENWRRVAAVIDTEFRRVDKFTATLGGIRRIVVTDSWVMVVSSYSVRLSQQADVRLTVTQTDEHALSHLITGEGGSGQVGVQFLNILVQNISKPVQPFILRLDAREYRMLRAKLQAPLQTAHDVVIQQSVSERFVLAFQEHVQQNPPYVMPEDQRAALEPCIGCMQESSNVKLERHCSSDAPVGVNSEGQPLPACFRCYCRPMWCVACMGRWFASRQDQNHTDTWLSGKAPCPTCRAVFCLLDVSVIA